MATDCYAQIHRIICSSFLCFFKGLKLQSFCLDQQYKYKQKALLKSKALIFHESKNYFLNLEYLVLNLSIRPAVSISLDLPV